MNLNLTYLHVATLMPITLVVWSRKSKQWDAGSNPGQPVEFVPHFKISTLDTGSLHINLLNHGSC